MGELDFLDEFSGPKPRRRGFAISVSPEAMALIGHLTLQWGALIEGIQFLIKFKSRFPEVPAEIKEQMVRHEATQQIKLLRKIGAYIYANKRPTAVSEFNSILDEILILKESRDALVHGMFALTDNTNPNVVVVIYKHGKKSFHLMDLRQIGDRIGIANVSLKPSDQWVDYASTLASFKKLAQQEHR